MPILQAQIIRFEQLLQELAQVFLTECEEKIKEMEDAITAGDGAEIDRLVPELQARINSES